MKDAGEANQSRSLSDRLGEAMRRERLGMMRPLWFDCTEVQKADWRRRAEHLVRVANSLGLQITIKER